MHLSITISGKVQGVFYRASTREKASDLGLKGFVQNNEDGSVYIEAEGDESALQQLVEWCKVGPANAVVTKVKISEGEMKGYGSFQIKRW